MPLTSLPSDVLSMITLHIPFLDAVKLCQVSKHFLQCLRGDKRLWMEHLQHEVLSKGIKLPRYCKNLDDASSEDVYSWVKTSISLQKAYSSGGRNAVLISVEIDKELEATWSKIIRGRWCLAALSNPTTSLLGVWQILSDGSLKLERKYYLPGPVLDGLVEDNSNEIHIAVTIGTSTPYIQILNFGMEEGAPGLRSVQVLEGARHVLLLRGFVIGYKTSYGDDTYPLLTYWSTGTTTRLYSSLFCLNPDMMLGDILSHCHAMCIWRDHIFAVFDYTIEVFPLPYFDESSPFVNGVQLLQFPHISAERLESPWIVEAFIYEIGQVPVGVDYKPSSRPLFISVRDRIGCQYIRAITQAQDGSFSWDANFLKEIEYDVESHRHCIGTATEYQLRLASKGGTRDNPIFLQVVRPQLVSVGNASSDIRVGDKQTYVVSTPNLPNLDLTTTMDFDDGVGVILLGTCLGEIIVIQILYNSSRGSGALSDELPLMFCNLPELDMSPLSSELPSCYRLYDQIYEGSVPLSVREETIVTWDKVFGSPKITLPPGWSSDWREHKSFQNWVLPFSRWRTLAADRFVPCSYAWSREIQTRIGDTGDIIPIMYKEENHDFVIFKIAFRVYYFLRGPPLDPMDHLICALPFTVEQLANPDVLERIWLNRWMRGRLCEGGGDGSSHHHKYIMSKCLAVLRYLETEEGGRELRERSLTKDSRTWPLNDRRAIFRKANSAYEASQKRMNAPLDFFGDY